MKKITSIFVIILISLLYTSCSLFEKEEKDYSFPRQELDRIDDLSIFSQVFEKYLSLDFRDPLTIFAPSDDAFNNLLKNYGVNTFEELCLRVGGEEYFKEILEFHILPEKKLLLEFTEPMAYSINGQQMRLLYLRDTLRVIEDGFFGSSAIIQYNIPIHKGTSVVHKVHRVLRPNYKTFLKKDLIHEANRMGCSHFLTALSLLDDVKELVLNLEQTTVFVPNNSAFQRLMFQHKVIKMEDLINKIGKEKFKEILLHHIIPKVVWFPNFNEDYTFNTISGKFIKIRKSYFFNLISDNRGHTFSIISVDHNFKNGNFHLIDGVLIP